MVGWTWHFAPAVLQHMCLPSDAAIAEALVKYSAMVNGFDTGLHRVRLSDSECCR